MEQSGEGTDSLLYSAVEASSDVELLAAGGEGVDVGDDYEGENGVGGDGGRQEETSKLNLPMQSIGGVDKAGWEEERQRVEKEATERFEATNPILKEVALAAVPLYEQAF